MKTINYKGKGEHSVRELELIIEQQAEELHLIKSGQKPCNIHGVISPLSVQEVLNYEIHSHGLSGWIGFEWGQDLMGTYFAWKVRKKYNRYLVSLKERKRVLNGL